MAVERVGKRVIHGVVNRTTITLPCKSLCHPPPSCPRHLRRTTN
jgi:hypothetical protein